MVCSKCFILKSFTQVIPIQELLLSYIKQKSGWGTKADKIAKKGDPTIDLCGEHTDI